MNKNAQKLLFISICCVSCLLFGCHAQQMPISQGNVEIYFCHLFDCNEVFSNLTRHADSLSCAFYEIDHPELLAHLDVASAFLLVDKNAETSFGKHRTGPGLMHHKFCVINHTTLITGSFNPVVKRDADFNNVVVLEAPPLAQRYEQSLHHKKVTQRRFLHNDFLIESYFCPEDDCQEQLLAVLEQANTSISFALFTFTDKEIAALLIEKHHEGVNISGIVESWQAKQYNQYYVLAAQGIPIHLETSSRLQHNKIFVIDERVVITGSYNPTKAATTINDENILIIHEETIARRYSALVRDIIKSTQNFK